MKKKTANKEPGQNDEPISGEAKIAESYTFSYGLGVATLLILDPGQNAYAAGYCSYGWYYSYSGTKYLGGYPCAT